MNNVEINIFSDNDLDHRLYEVSIRTLGRLFYERSQVSGSFIRLNKLYNTDDIDTAIVGRLLIELGKSLIFATGRTDYEQTNIGKHLLHG